MSSIPCLWSNFPNLSLTVKAFASMSLTADAKPNYSQNKLATKQWKPIK